MGGGLIIALALVCDLLLVLLRAGADPVAAAPQPRREPPSISSAAQARPLSGRLR